MSATLHFVECRFRSGTAFIERDPNDMDLETTIRDIASGQIENPVRVLAVFTEESFARDVTEDIAREIAARNVAEPLAPSLIEFVEHACGPLLANELVEDAA